MNIGIGIGIGKTALSVQTLSDSYISLAWASALSPGVTTTQADHKTVNAVVAESDVSSINPSVSVVAAVSVTVNAVQGNVNADILTPVISNAQNISVSPVSADSNAVALLPSVSAVNNASTSYYLQMDGVDDKLQLPSMTVTKIVLDILIDSVQGSRDVVADARTGHTGLLDMGYVTGFTLYVNGVKKPGQSDLLKDQRFALWLNHSTEGTAFTDDITIYSRNDGLNNLKGNIWDIKLYNGATLMAHYDMSMQTVQDQSGNGRHATLTGGTWVAA